MAAQCTSGSCATGYMDGTNNDCVGECVYVIFNNGTCISSNVFITISFTSLDYGDMVLYDL